MHLPRKDLVATGLVAAAVVLYLLWAVDLVLPGIGTRATAAGILVLGIAASVSAVVPGFDQLIRGNKAYLAGTSILGVVALVAGVQVMLTSGGQALTVLISTTVGLWAISTTHHMLSAKDTPAPPRVETYQPADRR